MWVQTACDALRSGHVLQLRYDGYTRDVEVHAVGGSVSNEPTGWKMLRLDEATGASITKQRSLAPRPGYKSGDKAMKVITCQL